MRALILATAVAALVFLVLYLTKPTDKPEEAAIRIAPSGDQPAGAANPYFSGNERESVAELNPEFFHSGGCLTEEQFESHPLIAEEALRLAPFSTFTEEMSAYRNLTEDELLPLVQQGDAAAMVVMGAIEFMRAQGRSDDEAVPYLAMEGGSYLKAGPIPDDRMQHYENAGKWFYEAALHGRVLALANLGIVLTFQRKTPVELGWVSEAEFSSMARSEKTVFNAANVYLGLAHTIAPNLKIDFIDEGVGFFGTQSARKHADIIQPLYEQFENDRKKRGLPPIKVPKSKLPPLSEIENILCNSPDRSK